MSEQVLIIFFGSNNLNTFTEDLHLFCYTISAFCFVNDFFFCFLSLFQVFFGTQQSRLYLSANSIGINCTTGMSCLMRKDLIDQAGGMSAFGKYLAEDYFFAEAIREKWASVFFSIDYLLLQFLTHRFLLLIWNNYNHSDTSIHPNNHDHWQFPITSRFSIHFYKKIVQFL